MPAGPRPGKRHKSAIRRLGLPTQSSGPANWVGAQARILVRTHTGAMDSQAFLLSASKMLLEHCLLECRDAFSYFVLIRH